MNLSHLNRPHEEATKVFWAEAGCDVEFEVHCRICGQVAETTITVPDTRMGSIKLLYRCPGCLYSGMLVLSPIEETR